MSLEPKLMQLSIPRGWAVGDNKFYDVEPRLMEAGNDFIDNAMEGFVEDVLWIFEWKYEIDKNGKSQLIIPERNQYSIDMGWHPDSRMNGQYYATLYWNGAEQRTEVETFTSKNRFEVRDKMEVWMNEITINYQASHSRFL